MNHTWGSAKNVPKLSSLNIVIGTFPLTRVYSRKAVIGNFPPVIGEGFFMKGTKLKGLTNSKRRGAGLIYLPTLEFAGMTAPKMQDTEKAGNINQN